MEYEEILGALLNGTDPDEIADDFIEKLNRAIKERDARNKELEKAKAREAALLNIFNQIKELTPLLNEILDFIKKYYPNLMEGLDSLKILDIDTKDLNEMVSKILDNINNNI